MPLDIKNLLELLAALQLLGVQGAKIAKDKKISVEDLAHVLELAKNVKVLVEGVQDLDVALLEAKDLDQAEVVTLITEVYKIVAAIKAA